MMDWRWNTQIKGIYELCRPRILVIGQSEMSTFKLSINTNIRDEKKVADSMKNVAYS